MNSPGAPCRHTETTLRLRRDGTLVAAWCVACKYRLSDDEATALHRDLQARFGNLAPPSGEPRDN